jgi:prepilin-type N-terminal cleavage/methylation domain-containing protein
MNLHTRTLSSEFGIRNFLIPQSAIRNPKLSRAFTLIELLVVIAIIGILAAIGLPAMRGMTRSNAMIAANRQFLDDLAYARQRAIADHTSVYVVFVSTNILKAGNVPLPLPPNLALYKQYTNLYTGQFTTYALLSLRQIGEQPGRATPLYLTGWRSLPNGVFIAQSKFALPPNPGVFPLAYGLPFPVATYYPTNLPMPCLIFNYQGQLFLPNGQADQDEYIPFARGSIFINSFNHLADVQENPVGNSVINSNVVYINALTGRAKILQPQLQ